MLYREALNCPPPRQDDDVARDFNFNVSPNLFRDLVIHKLEGRQLKPTDVKKSGGQASLEGKKIGRYEGRLFSVNSLSSNPPTLLSSNNQPLTLSRKGRRTLHPSLKKKPASTLAEGATHVAHFDNVRRVAFTLAEVLITLGIIGVVAALTLPSLIQEKQHKQLEAQFKKGYSAIQQAVLRASLEHSDLGSLYNEDFNTNRVTESGGEYIYEVLGKQFAGATTAKVAPSEVLNRIKTYNNNVLNTSNVTAATALDEGPATHTTVLLYNHTTGQNGFAVDVAFTRQVAVDTQDTIVVDPAIVTDAGTLHHADVIADDGFALGMGSAVDDDILANGIVVADSQSSGFTLVVEVLRLGTEDSPLKDPVVFSHDRSRQYTGVWIYHTVVTDDNIFVDIGKGMYGYVVSNHRFGIDVC